MQTVDESISSFSYETYESSKYSFNKYIEQKKLGGTEHVLSQKRNETKQN